MRKLEVETVKWMIRQREAEEAAARKAQGRRLPKVKESSWVEDLLAGVSIVGLFYVYGIAVLIWG